MARLGDICKKASSSVAQKDLEAREGQYPIYGASGLIKYVDFYHQEKPYVAVVKDGAGVGRVMQLPAKSSVIGTMQYIIPNDGVNVSYLAYALEHMNLAKYYTGATIPHIYFKDYCNEAMPDHGKEEQKYIAEILDKVNSLVTLRKQQLVNLDELVKARFVELFGSKENKISISEMCNVTGGYSFKSGDISNDGAIKILQIGNVNLDNVSWETTNYLPEGYDEKYSKFMLNEGDIVVALTRPIIQSLGNVKACIVKSSDLPCLLNQRVGRIVAKNEKIIFLEFIYGCLMTDDFTRYVETCSIGCSQPNISTKDIENYLIPNATYEEQKAYVEFKKQTDKSKLAIQQSLEKLETLKKALMQQYFG